MFVLNFRLHCTPDKRNWEYSTIFPYEPKQKGSDGNRPSQVKRCSVVVRHSVQKILPRPIQIVLEGVIRQSDQCVDSDAGDEPVEPGLRAGACRDEAVPLDPAPIGGVTREQEVRTDTELAIVPISPELKRFAASDVVVRVFPPFGIAIAAFVQQSRLQQIVRSVGIITRTGILHGRNQDDDMARLPFDRDGSMPASLHDCPQSRRYCVFRKLPRQILRSDSLHQILLLWVGFRNVQLPLYFGS